MPRAKVVLEVPLTREELLVAVRALGEYEGQLVYEADESSMKELGAAGDLRVKLYSLVRS